MIEFAKKLAVEFIKRFIYSFTSKITEVLWLLPEISL
jgi:hypothetical protein